MSWTKRQFVDAAFAEVGYASYAFDLDPEQLQEALRRLDAMLATWNGQGIRLGYLIPSSPEDSSLDDESGVPDSANEAVYSNLAIRVAPIIGKIVSQETRSTARAAYQVLLSRAAMPEEQQLPGSMPAGAGNKPWRTQNPFLQPPTDPLLAGEDGEIEFD